MRPLAALLPLIAATCLGTAASPAEAQWKWKDAAGHVHYSDLPPPPDTPARDVLQRPDARSALRAPATANAASDASPPASAASGTDPALDARKRKLAQDEAAQAAARLKAEQDKQAALRRDNCAQAQAQLRTLDDGMRITRINAQGEREFLDDQARATERARAQDVVNSQCR